MKILVFLVLLIPSTSFAGFFDFLDPMNKVEKQIMTNNYDEAKETFLLIADKKFVFENNWAVIGSIDYLQSSVEFAKIADLDTDPQKALIFYREIVRKDDGKIPRTLPFSGEVIAKINRVISENNNIIKRLENLSEIQQLEQREKEKLKSQEEEIKRQEHQAQITEALRIKKEEEEQRIKEQFLKYQQEDLARQKKIEAENIKIQEKHASAEAARKVKEETLKSECGNDYKVVRVGMKLSRVEKCVGKFNLTGQINRVDGIISTYENQYGFIHIMDGVVVSWGHY